MTARELTIHQAQTCQPWTVPYDPAVLAAERAVPHILATHDVLHAAKTVGKLAGVFEALDHKTAAPSADQFATIRGCAADLVTEALRLANLYGFDLAAELVDRVAEKNGVNLLAVAPI